MAKRVDTIKYFKSFLTKFLKDNPNLSENQKKLVEQLQDGLEAIEKNKTDLQNLFDIENSKMLEDLNSLYPSDIRKFHRGVAGIIGAAAFVISYLGVGYLLGGPNIEAWSEILAIIGITGGVVTGTGLTVLDAVVSQKTFDKKKPRGIIEKRIMKNLNKKLLVTSSLNSDINISLDQILRGKYKFKEVVTVEKTRNTKNGPVTKVEQVVRFTDQFKHLPRKTKRKLNKLINNMGDNYDKISLAYASIISQGIVEVTNKANALIDDIEDLIKDTELSIGKTKSEVHKEKKTQKGITVAGNSTKEKAKKLIEATKLLENYMKELDALISIDLDDSREFVVDEHVKKIEKAVVQAKKILKEARETISESNETLKEANETLKTVKETLDQLKIISKEKRQKPKAKGTKNETVDEENYEEEEETISKSKSNTHNPRGR